MPIKNPFFRDFFFIIVEVLATINLSRSYKKFVARDIYCFNAAKNEYHSLFSSFFRSFKEEYLLVMLAISIAKNDIKNFGARSFQTFFLSYVVI